jgi:hypothetical protein
MSCPHTVRRSSGTSRYSAKRGTKSFSRSSQLQHTNPKPCTSPRAFPDPMKPVISSGNPKKKHSRPRLQRAAAHPAILPCRTHLESEYTEYYLCIVNDGVSTVMVGMSRQVERDCLVSSSSCSFYVNGRRCLQLLLFLPSVGGKERLVAVCPTRSRRQPSL